MKTARTTASAVLFCLCLAAVPGSVRAFGIETLDDTLKGTIVRWNALPISYYLDEGGTNGLTASQAQQCFRDSFRDWEAVDCSRLAFRELGTTSNKRVLPMSSSYNVYQNGRNELVWINDSTWTFGSQVLGVTMTNGTWNWGTITESDIAFNGRNYKWNLTGTIGYWNNDMDCKSVAIHEIGHLFGLQHVLSGASVTDPPTMAPAVDPQGRSASLARDDQLGACFLYPEGQYYTCTKNSECPKVVGHNSRTGEEYEVGQIYCQNGYCQGGGGSAPNSVEMGGTCSTNTDCVQGLTCRNYYSETKICTTTCDPLNDQCPDQFHCEVPQGETASLCMPGSKKIPVGEPCTRSYDCSTSFCFPAPDGSGMTCRVSCTRDGNQCAPNEACWSVSASSTGGCYPKDQVPVPKKKLDVECAADGECESGLCYSEEGETPRCRLRCDPASPFCYAGYWCRDLGNGSGACIPGDGKKADGEECAEQQECRSGWCVWTPTLGRSYCRSSCELSTWECPEGTSCVSFGSTEWGVCMPDRTPTGEGCSTHGDCTTALCVQFGGDYGQICTQACVGGWCPNDWTCHVVGEFGEICGPAEAGTPEVLPTEDTGTPPDVGTQEDRGEQTDLGTPPDEGGQSVDQGTVPPPPSGNGGGCIAGPAGAVGGWAWGSGIALLGLAAFRRRGRR